MTSVINNDECSVLSTTEAGPRSSLGVTLIYLGTGTSKESRWEEAGPSSLSLSLSFSLFVFRFLSLVRSVSHSLSRSLDLSLSLSLSRTLSLAFACKGSF